MIEQFCILFKNLILILQIYRNYRRKYANTLTTELLHFSASAPDAHHRGNYNVENLGTIQSGVIILSKILQSGHCSGIFTNYLSDSTLYDTHCM